MLVMMRLIFRPLTTFGHTKAADMPAAISFRTSSQLAPWRGSLEMKVLRGFKVELELLHYLAV